MSENQFNPKEGRNCHSCVYIEHKQGTAHKGCKRAFEMGRYLFGTMTNKTTYKVEQVKVFVDQISAKMVIKKELKVQIACTIKINQWTRMFPVDFDPYWVVVCTGWSKELDERFVVKRTPMEKMFGILGSVGRI